MYSYRGFSVFVCCSVSLQYFAFVSLLLLSMMLCMAQYGSNVQKEWTEPSVTTEITGGFAHSVVYTWGREQLRIDSRDVFKIIQIWKTQVQLIRVYH